MLKDPSSGRVGNNYNVPAGVVVVVVIVESYAMINNGSTTGVPGPHTAKDRLASKILMASTHHIGCSYKRNICHKHSSESTPLWL
jgi:hypothetical protein